MSPSIFLLLNGEVSMLQEIDRSKWSQSELRQAAPLHCLWVSHDWGNTFETSRAAALAQGSMQACYLDGNAASVDMTAVRVVRKEGYLRQLKGDVAIPILEEVLSTAFAEKGRAVSLSSEWISLYVAQRSGEIIDKMWQTYIEQIIEESRLSHEASKKKIEQQALHHAQWLVQQVVKSVVESNYLEKVL